MPKNAPRHNIAYTFYKIVFLATCYALIGRLSLLLAIPPGYATAIFPSAGLALASLLLWGTRLWPGVFLGSFILNIWIGLELSQLTDLKFLATLGAASGATLQAIIAAKLIRHYVGFPTTLSRDKDILLFLIIGGPVSCLTSASIGIASLYFFGILEYSNVTYSWMTWWVGDAIGVMISLPLIFVIFARPKDIWRDRLYVITIPLVAMISVVISLFVWVSQWEEERNQFELKEIASNNAEKLRSSFSSYVDAVASIERFYVSSTQSTIKREEFKTFVEYHLQNKSGINGLSWNPVVFDEQRTSFENSVKQKGFPTFKIKERSNGELISASKRATYIPVHYIEPMLGNEQAFGFDVASSQQRKSTLDLSRDTGDAFATPRISLVQEQGKQAGILLFYPVYSGVHSTLEQRRENIKGFAVGVFRVGDITDAVLSAQVKKKVTVGIYDITDGKSTQLYGPENMKLHMPNTFKVTEKITIGNRQWQVVYWPSSEYLASHSSWQAWGALALGLLLISFSGAFLLSMTGRSHSLNAEVKERTAEIEANRLEIIKANNALEERNQQLEHSNQELDQYAFVASHDLKSPLNAVEQLASWIEEDCHDVLPSESRTHLQLLKQRVQRMKNLLADILVYSRVSRDSYQLESVKLDCLIESAVSFNYIPESFEIKIIHCDITLNLPKVLIELAIRNLLSNAVKHHDKSHGEISIEYQQDKGMQVISVTDDGPGIPPNLQDKAMEMFSTLQSRDETEGSGLGLSMVKKVMVRLNGQIKIKSDGKSSTTVELVWPLDIKSEESS